ncbi:meiotic recombination protein REC114-like isoform X2 [Salvelinus fontinalis]|uniref:meiotic recombination protein REC114-like isoform X2 n=1 Tax=Salvelinus fontinalis TaxID=8038 RepID=UPI00248519B9|nr:meiotic recombination protein REC114-like isoform X2 [Salvelinus fontinalis]
MNSARRDALFLQICVSCLSIINNAMQSRTIGYISSASKDPMTSIPSILDGFSLLDAPSFLKVQQKSDTLLFRLTVKGESRLIRMQFSGSRAEALEECGSAVLRLKEYLPVTTQGGPLPPRSCPPTPNQPPTKTTAQDQQGSAGEAMATEPEVVQGSLSIKRLTQHFLGEHGLSLPLVYRHSDLFRGELEPFLRLCLLDPSFPALVEEMEGELKRVLQD